MFLVFPYKRITIPTSLTIEKSVNLISAAISPKRTIDTWFTSTSKEFEGTVNEQGFKIQKVIHNRNSFLPVLHGKFVPTPSGTKIEAQLTFDILVIIFSIIWVAGMGGAFLISVLGSMQAGKPDEFTWFPLLALGFFCLMVFIGFGSHARRTEEFILNLFERFRIE